MNNKTVNTSTANSITGSNITGSNTSGKIILKPKQKKLFKNPNPTLSLTETKTDNTESKNVIKINKDYEELLKLVQITDNIEDSYDESHAVIMLSKQTVSDPLINNNLNISIGEIEDYLLEMIDNVVKTNANKTIPDKCNYEDEKVMYNVVDTLLLEMVCLDKLVLSNKKVISLINTPPKYHILIMAVNQIKFLKSNTSPNEINELRKKLGKNIIEKKILHDLFKKINNKEPIDDKNKLEQYIDSSIYMFMMHSYYNNEEYYRTNKDNVNFIFGAEIIFNMISTFNTIRNELNLVDSKMPINKDNCPDKYVFVFEKIASIKKLLIDNQLKLDILIGVFRCLTTDNKDDVMIFGKTELMTGIVEDISDLVFKFLDIKGMIDMITNIKTTLAL